MFFIVPEEGVPSASRPLDCARGLMRKWLAMMEASLGLLMRRKHYNEMIMGH
jgi:hypothetical protein